MRNYNNNFDLYEELEEVKTKLQKTEQRLKMIEKILRKHYEDDMF